jgi:hypothetical protein
MAITQTGSTLAIQATTTANTGTASTAITVPADAELVVVGVSGFTSANGMSGGAMTFTKGGVDTAMSATTGGNASTSVWQCGMFYLAVPDTGSNKTLKWDWAGAGASGDPVFNFSLTFWKGVDTASPVRDSDGAQGSSAALPLSTPTLTAQSGDLIVAFSGFFHAAQDGAGQVDTWSNLTELTEIAHNSYSEGAWATGSPSGNTTVGVSTGTGWEEGGIVAVVVKPAGTAKAIPPFRRSRRFFNRPFSLI